MSAAQTTEVFNCSVEELYKIITDYERYPEFLSEVKGCKVIDKKDNKKLVEFHVSMIKSFSYRLWVTELPNKGITWVLESGDLFKISNGSWDLKDEAGRARATYAVDASFKVFVPGPVAKALVNVNLPNMVSAYHKRVKELYGK